MALENIWDATSPLFVQFQVGSDRSDSSKIYSAEKAQQLDNFV